MVMNMMRAKLGLTGLLLAALMLLVTACSPSAAKLTDTGNQAFAKQAYDEAARAYAEAQANSPELAEPYYNSANVLYREGKYEEALKALQQAAQIAQTGPVAQSSHFNAGNAAFSAKGWEAAVESYRQALLRDPADLDAKHNLELALQQVKQQQNQQQDQQNQDQQKDDRGQQDQQQNGQGQQDQQNQDQQQNGQGQQDQQNQDQQQNGQGQQDQQNQDQQQNGQGQQDQQNQDQKQNGQGQQDQQNQDQKQGQQDQTQDGQDQRDQKAQTSKQQDGQQRSGSQLAPGQRMTQDQARQLLAAIAAKSDTLQGRLGQFLQVRGRPPLQDW
jgi:Ca-activated chloride channel family protein